MLQPRARPPQAEKSATSSVTPAKLSGELRFNSTPGLRSSHAAGMTTRPANSACRVPKITFRSERHKQRDPGKTERRTQVQFHSRPQEQPRCWDDDQAGKQRLQGAKNNFLYGQP